ncbi:MAG TPA: glycosyltransferase, partial [Candidatus Saccharimonadales bacterium]|nr:glycosyltransferase [Candidatus Saccharimonadales bacterium]
MPKKLKVAMVAPPWLKIPPDGYGAIEYILEYLAQELPKLGVEVVLFTIGETTLKGVKKRYFYEHEQYEHIHKALYDAINIPVTQSLFALNAIKKAGDFDIIHDHTFHLGGSTMAHLDPRAFPPVLCTLHGAFSTDETIKQGLPDNRPMFSQMATAERLYFAGISNAQLSHAPAALKKRLVGVVHNAIKVGEFAFSDKKQDYFITLARFNRDKGQALAAKLCDELGYNLKMAALVAGITTPRKLLLELTNPISPYRHFADFK